MILPKWVTFEIFEKALNNYTHRDVNLIKFETTNAVPDGDNFCSDLFRSTIFYKDLKKNSNSTISVIIKCANEEGGTKTDIAKTLNLFAKEIEIFTKTFPEIYKILSEWEIFSSKCLYSSLNPHSIIIFEDLTTLGYQMLSRHDGFDLNHCLLVIEKLAKMHAASVIMYERDPSLVKLYKVGLYPDNEIIRSWLGAGYSAVIDACSRWPGCEKYGYKLAALGEEAIRRSFEASRKQQGGFHVLCHGDLWTNNMMFSYDSQNNLNDMRFVDFQMNIFSSPALDLHNFIATSTDMDVKEKHVDGVLDFYYAHLIANLTKLKYPLDKVPTRKEFKKDYNSRAFYGLMAASSVLPFVKATCRKDASFESVIKDDSKEGFRYHAYNNERYRRHMEWLLPYYDSFGILE